MTTNKAVIIVITSTIAALAFSCVICVCLLSYWAIQIPPELNTLTGGLVGALTAMLVKTSPTETLKQPAPNPLQQGDNVPVVIQNKPNDPVPTDQVDKPTETKP